MNRLMIDGIDKVSWSGRDMMIHVHNGIVVFGNSYPKTVSMDSMDVSMEAGEPVSMTANFEISISQKPPGQPVWNRNIPVGIVVSRKQMETEYSEIDPQAVLGKIWSEFLKRIVKEQSNFEGGPPDDGDFL